MFMPGSSSIKTQFSDNKATGKLENQARKSILAAEVNYDVSI